jgi:O-antigen ligase
MARFVTTFAAEERRDDSAASRLDLWKGCLSEMIDHPLLGIGPDHWRLVAHEHGFTPGKAAHSTWMQTAAEGGVIAFASLLLFYSLCIVRLWPIATGAESEPQAIIARMVVCSLCGYMLAAQFVSVNMVEVSYYIAAVGAGVLKLVPTTSPALAGELHSSQWHGWTDQPGAVV